MDTKGLYKIAFGLALFTVVYNVAEGLFSTFFGFQDESLALFGFGIDSFIEVVSGMGIAHMVLRIRRNPLSTRDAFEKRALRITGSSFYGLVAGLVITSAYNLITGKQPETTFWGVVISIISIVAMWTLIYVKKRVGGLLGSDAITADAQCTKVCLYMSVILLISSGIYQLFKIPYIDTAGTLGLAYLSFKEGRECFEKARSGSNCCSSCSCHTEISENNS